MSNKAKRIKELIVDKELISEESLKQIEKDLFDSEFQPGGFTGESYMIRRYPPRNIGIWKSPSKQKTTATIADVHNEFDTAAENILNEAQRIIDETTDEDYSQFVQLKELGFKNPQTVKAVERYNRLQEAQKNASAIAYYARKYPGHRFMTDKELKRICKKYGLVIGNTDNFIGDIPKENRQELLDFELNTEDYGYVYRFKRWGNTVELPQRDFEREYSGINEVEGLQRKKKKYFKIVGTPDQFDMTEYEINAEFELVEKDPVVLQPVEGGYLIVTKWGDEADIEELK